MTEPQRLHPATPRIRVGWTPLGFEDERTIWISRPGHWSFALVLPRLIWTRRKDGGAR